MTDKYDVNTKSPFDSLIRQSADANGVPYELLHKIGWVESRFDPNAVSPKGPVGMFQMTKATGRAMGLTITDDGTIDERKDPKKSSQAAGKLLRTLIDKYNGDHLKAVLAYNQGEGPSGRVSLSAYDNGNFSGVNAEGLNYMKNLSDVAQSPKKDALLNFGGITQDAKPFTVDDYLQSLGDSHQGNSVSPTGNQSPYLDFQQAQADKPVQFSEAFKQVHGQSEQQQEDAVGAFTGVGQAVKSNVTNSVVGMTVRGMTKEYGGSVFDLLLSNRYGDFIPDDSDYTRWEKMGIRPEYWTVIMGGDKEHVADREKMALANQTEDDKTSQGSGWGAKLIGGVAYAATDPLSYVPFVGMGGKAFKGLSLASRMVRGSANGAVTSSLSEMVRTDIAGGEAHYKSAVIGGAIFGSGAGALTHMLLKRADMKLRNMEPPTEVTGTWYGREFFNDGRIGTQGPDVPPMPPNPTLRISGDEFSGAANRIEARETSITMGIDDITRRTPPEEFSGDLNGVPFAHAGGNGSDAILGDGSIVSGGSPVNPINIHSSKAAAGIPLGDFTEIGQRILRSDNQQLRDIGQFLVRPATGTMEDGGFGFKGMTMDDIAKWGESQDHMTYNNLYKATKEALEEGRGIYGPYSKEVLYEKLSERVSKAIENPHLVNSLTDKERAVMNIVKENYANKANYLTDTKRFGRQDAPPVADSLSHYKDRYTPRVYSREKKLSMIDRLGSPEALQRVITDGWLAAYRNDPQEIDKMLKEALQRDHTYADVEAFLHNKAYGISHSDMFDGAHLVDSELRGGAGLENNEFLEMRVPLGTSEVVMTPSGPFSIDDIREWNINRNMMHYNRRMNGSIAIHGSTGMTEEQLKQQILQLRKHADAAQNRQLHSEVDAMLEAVKMATGRARRNPDGLMGTAFKSMTDLAFFSKNAYMGAQNLTEAATLYNRGGMRTLMNNIPMLQKFAFSDKINGSDIKVAHGIIWGKELDDSIRPTSKEIIQNIRDSSTAPDFAVKTVGYAKYLTGELAQRSPWTKFLKETTNVLIDAGRQNVLADITATALKGKKSLYMNQKMLDAMGVTKEQAKEVTEWVKKYTEVMPDGEIRWKTDELRATGRNDPASFTMWRIGDYVASETLLRPGRISLADSKASSPFTKMFTQFKTFTLKSLNNKFIRSYYQATKNGRAVDQTMAALTSIGVAGMYYVAQSHLKAQGLPEQQRKAYLKNALDQDQIVYNSISRSSIVGSPISAWNIFAAPFGAAVGGTYGRSTILADERQAARKDRPVLSASRSEQFSDFLVNATKQVPAVNVPLQGWALVHNAYGKATSHGYADQMNYGTGIYNAAKELTPNDPISQQVLLHIMKDRGIHIVPK